MAQTLYDRIGIGYSARRRPDPRIAAHILAALGPARTVVNIGAGSGSYEPTDRSVVAVEPSVEMIRQREQAATAVRAVAGRLPFPDGAFDAALAVLTIHHWPDWRRGLAEMRRVARERVVVFTKDPDQSGFWLAQEYLPEILEIDRPIFPPADEIARALGAAEVRAVPVPADCSDGFMGSYWRRPEAFLDAGVRGAISTFRKMKQAESGLERLRADLASGAWQKRHEAMLALDELDVGYRLIVASIAP